MSSTVTMQRLRISTVSHFSRNHSNRLRSAPDYQSVGRKMFELYPCIARFGTHPWSCLMASLSSRMRSFRFKKRQKDGEKVKKKLQHEFTIRKESKIKPEVNVATALLIYIRWGHGITQIIFCDIFSHAKYPESATVMMVGPLNTYTSTYSLELGGSD